jgi:hypothetical protein
MTAFTPHLHPLYLPGQSKYLSSPKYIYDTDTEGTYCLVTLKYFLEETNPEKIEAGK